MVMAGPHYPLAVFARPVPVLPMAVMLMSLKWMPPQIPVLMMCVRSLTVWAISRSRHALKSTSLMKCICSLQSAFNALLKTLEEPPEAVKFIFATTEIRKVPVTVLSRCQRFDLRRVPNDMMAGHLKNICAKENITAEDVALDRIARAAEGSVRDALSLLDQAAALNRRSDQG